MPQDNSDLARKTTAPRKRAATGKAELAPTAQRRELSPEQVHLIKMLDETMTRLDHGIEKERSALDALLSRMASKAA